jgi:ribose 5-phosphate isomerase B
LIIDQEERMKKVAIGCDPNAEAQKQEVIKLLIELGYECEDYGSVDPVYANVAIDLSEAVASGKHDRGILMCGTGIGMSIAANKVHGVYAALCTDIYSTERSILSNNANVMCVGAFTLGISHMKELVKAWMAAEWEVGCRSESKVQRFRDYDNEHIK